MRPIMDITTTEMGNSTLNHYGFAMDIVQQTPTPFYYYDIDLLRDTLQAIRQHTAGFPYRVHYAVKAKKPILTPRG